MGRKRFAPKIEQAIKADLDAGKGMIATEKADGVGVSVVQRIKAA